MKTFKRISVLIAARFTGPQRASSIFAVVLACLAAAGGLWMIVTAGEAEMVPVSVPENSSQDVAHWAERLKLNAVPCNVQEGRLLVASQDHAQAQALLADEDAGPPNSATGKWVGSDDLWLTRAAGEHRRRAARLATLGKLIAQFPDVSSAVVLYEPPTTVRIGQPQQSPTAAVHVRMQGDAAMPQHLVHAIADLVTGGISGLSPADVCVIDHRGRSYRADADALAAEEAQAARKALAADCHRRVRQALSHIDGLTVVATISPGSPPRCIGARVSVPWRYYQAVAERANGDLLAVSVGESMRIRQTVTELLNVPDVEAVVVDIHRDLMLAAAPTAEPAGVSRAAPPLLWVAAVLAVAGALCAIAAVRRRRAPRNVQDWSPRETLQPGPLAALDDLAEEDLVWLLAAERPQTIAVVIRQLPRKRSGAVLASFDRPQQRQIVQHLSDLDKVPAETIEAIITSLSERLVAIRDSAGPKATVAELVDRWDARTPDGSGETPSRGALEFEDIVDVPGAILAAALARLDVRLVAVALRTAGESVRERIFRALGRRRTRHVRKQMDLIGPVRLGDVEAAQDRVAQAVRLEISAVSPRLMETAS